MSDIKKNSQTNHHSDAFLNKTSGDTVVQAPAPVRATSSLGQVLPGL